MLAPLWCILFSCSAINTNDIFYRIFQGSIDQYIDILSGNAAELYDNLNASKPTAFYVHGWRESCHNASAIEISSAILSRGGHNVCCLDWSKLAGDNYMSAATSTAKIAMIFAKDISAISDMGYQPKKMNAFGFSLGAHIVGGTGKNLQRANYPSIGQITALDPAKPLFDPSVCPECRRLEATDADMVYTIHTSGGSYGMMTAIGKCDIYPNYGTVIQKGCPVVPETLNPTQIMPTYRCSHDRSWKFYGEAIRNPGSHIAVNCDSSHAFATNSCSSNTISIGLDMPKHISGTYYYTTNAKSPYGRGIEGTNFPSS